MPLKKATTQSWRYKVELSGYYLKILQLFSQFELVSFSRGKKKLDLCTGRNKILWHNKVKKYQKDYNNVKLNKSINGVGVPRGVFH